MGGIDSTTCLYKAIIEYGPKDPADRPCDWVEAISIDYGQKHTKEIECAQRTCAKFNIPHKVLNLQGLLSGDGVMLTDANVDMVEKSYDEIEGVSPTYVPFRNGTLLSILAAHAQKWVMSEIEKMKMHKDEWTDQERLEHMRNSAGIYFGAHAEDAHNWAYPDCTPEFIGSISNAIYTGTYYTVRVHTPFAQAQKYEIVKEGARMGVNYADTWSCYAGGEKHCGKCPTCISRREAFFYAQVFDPTSYEVDYENDQ